MKVDLQSISRQSNTIIRMTEAEFRGVLHKMTLVRAQVHLNPLDIENSSTRFRERHSAYKDTELPPSVMRYIHFAARVMQAVRNAEPPAR